MRKICMFVFLGVFLFAYKAEAIFIDNGIGICEIEITQDPAWVQNVVDKYTTSNQGYPARVLSWGTWLHAVILGASSEETKIMEYWILAVDEDGMITFLTFSPIMDLACHPEYWDNKAIMGIVEEARSEYYRLNTGIHESMFFGMENWEITEKLMSDIFPSAILVGEHQLPYRFWKIEGFFE